MADAAPSTKEAGESDDNDLSNWKGTGLPRDDVRKAWEAMPTDTRPGWAAFVKQKREAHDRSKQVAKFEKGLEGFVAIKLTLPASHLDLWLATSTKFPPLKTLDATKPNHKMLVYRLTPSEKEELKQIWDKWKQDQIPPLPPPPIVPDIPDTPEVPGVPGVPHE